MSLDSASNQPDVFEDFATTTGGWKTSTSTELVTFTSGTCPSSPTLPTCVVTQDASCSATPTAWDNTKVKCTVAAGASYTSTSLDFNTDSAYEVTNLVIAWIKTGATTTSVCSTMFNVQVCQAPVMNLNQASPQQNIVIDFATQGGNGFQTIATTETISFGAGCSTMTPAVPTCVVTTGACSASSTAWDISKVDCAIILNSGAYSSTDIKYDTNQQFDKPGLKVVWVYNGQVQCTNTFSVSMCSDSSMTLNSASNQPDVFEDFATTTGGWKTSTTTEIITFTTGSCPGSPTLPTCVVTQDAVCSATPTAWDNSKVKCTVASGASYTSTSLDYNADSVYEVANLNIAWIKSGTPATFVCSTLFNVLVCQAPVMSINQASPQQDIAVDFAIAGGNGFQTTATTETISFAAGCSTMTPAIPTCVVTTGACSASATAWDTSKVDCAIVLNAGAYSSTDVKYNTNQQFTQADLSVVWIYNGQVQCSNTFTVSVCQDSTMTLNTASNQPDVFEDFATTMGGWKTSTTTELVTFTTGTCPGSPTLPTCVVTQDATCSATPTAWDNSKVKCTVVSGASYTSTTLDYNADSAYEVTNLNIAWIKSGASTTFVCSTMFNVQVCQAPVMSLNQASPQQDIAIDFATSGGNNFQTIATTETISFAAGCSTMTPAVPTCVVTTGACSASASAWDTSKVDCVIVLNAGAYSSTDVKYDTNQQFTQAGLKVVWVYNGQFSCSNDFTVSVCQDTSMTLNSASNQPDVFENFATTTGGWKTSTTTELVTFTAGTCPGSPSLPTCVVTQDATCSATPTIWDNSKVKCTVAAGASYTSTSLDYNADSAYEVTNLNIAWIKIGASTTFLCSTMFDVRVCQAPMMSLNQVSAQQNIAVDFATAGGNGFQTISTTEIISFSSGCSTMTPAVPTCVVTIGACSASTTAWDTSKVDCAINLNAGAYSSTDVKYDTNQQFIQAGLFVVWIYSGQVQCSNAFSVSVCQDSTMTLDQTNNQPDVFEDFATTTGGWKSSTTTELIAFTTGLCPGSPTLPTCVVTQDASCSATPTAWDNSKVKCTVTPGGSYTSTTLDFNADSTYEVTNLKIAWIKSGASTTFLCSTQFNVQVCQDHTLNIVQTTAQPNILVDHSTSGGGWTTVASTETINFSGGCSTIIPVPTCVVSTDACSASATAWDSTKVSCQIILNAGTYLSTDLKYKTAQQFTQAGLKIVWVYNGQVQCTNLFEISICDYPTMSIDQTNNQPDMLENFGTTVGGWIAKPITEPISFAGGTCANPALPTCVVTQDASCSATPTVWDATKARCTVTPGASYSATSFEFNADSAYEASGLSMAWVYQGFSAQAVCSTLFDVFVCNDPTMNIDQTSPQQDVFDDFATTSGGWTTAASTETISFAGGCSNAVPVPTCVVTTGSCAAAATDWDNTKVKCQIVSGPAYTSTNLQFNSDSEYEQVNLKIVWIYNGQVRCSNAFQVQVCRDQTMGINNIPNQPDLFQNFATTPGGWIPSAITETISFSGGTCSTPPSLPTCVVTNDATCSATPTVWDASKVTCTVATGATYSSTDVTFNVDSAYEQNGLKVAWKYVGKAATQFQCTTNFNVQVCSDPTMNIDQTTPEPDKFTDFATATPGWQTSLTVETISFAGGCSTTVPTPTCVVTTDTCSASVTAYDTSKVDCVITPGATYSTTSFKFSTNSAFEITGLKIAWIYNGQFRCTNPFDVRLCQDPTMALDSTTNQPDVIHDFVTTAGGWNTEASTEIISFSGGCSIDNPVPTCVVTDAACSASPTAWDTSKVDCTINLNAGSYSTTTLKFNSDAVFEKTGLKIAWLYTGRQTQNLCSTDFDVSVCVDPTMSIDQSSPQQKITHEFLTTSGGWQTGIPTSETISFAGGCSFVDPVPECFVGTTCSANPSNSNPNKVKCNVVTQGTSPQYVRSEISIKTDVEYTLNGLMVIWKYSRNQNQVHCSTPFTVDHYAGCNIKKYDENTCVFPQIDPVALANNEQVFTPQNMTGNQIETRLLNSQNSIKSHTFAYRNGIFYKSETNGNFACDGWAYYGCQPNQQMNWLEIVSTNINCNSQIKQPTQDANNLPGIRKECYCRLSADLCTMTAYTAWTANDADVIFTNNADTDLASLAVNTAAGFKRTYSLTATFLQGYTKTIHVTVVVCSHEIFRLGVRNPQDLTIVLIRKAGVIYNYPWNWQRWWFHCDGGTQSSANCCYWKKRLLKPVTYDPWDSRHQVDTHEERTGLNQPIRIDRTIGFALTHIILQYETRSGWTADLNMYIEVCGHEIIAGPNPVSELDFHYDRRSYTASTNALNPHQVIAANIYQLWTIQNSNNCPIVEYVIENSSGATFTENWAYLDTPTGDLYVSTWNGLDTMIWIYPRTEAGEIPQRKLNITIEVCGLETLYCPADQNYTQVWQREDNAVQTLPASSYKVFTSSSTFCHITNYDLVAFDGSTYVPYTGNTVTMLAGSGDVQISQSVSRHEIVYVQATTRGQRISNPNYKIDVDICGYEQVLANSSNPFLQQFKIPRYASTVIGEGYFFTYDQMLSSFYSSSTNCKIVEIQVVESKAGTYSNYTGKDVWQDETTRTLNVLTQNTFSRQLYLKVMTLQGTPYYHPVFFEVFENIELPEYINHPPAFMSIPQDAQYEFNSGDQNVQLVYDIQLPRPNDDKELLDVVKFSNPYFGTLEYKNLTFNETTLFSNKTQVWRFVLQSPSTASTMLDFNFETNILRITFQDIWYLLSYVGENPIDVLLTDQLGYESSYRFKVKFGNNYVKPVQIKVPEITDNCTAWIESVTNTGVVTIKFSDPMVKVNPSMINKDILDVYVEPTGIDITVEPESYNLTWKVTSFKDHIMKIQLTFNDPAAISPFSEREKIVWHVKQKINLFISQTNGHDLSSWFTTLRSDIPRQLYYEPATAILTSVAEVTTTVIQSTMIASYATAAAFSGTFFSMVGMVNTLQLIFHLPMMNIVFPANAMYLFQSMMPLVRLDFGALMSSDQEEPAEADLTVATETPNGGGARRLQEIVHDLSEQLQVPEQTIELGYDEVDPLINLRTILIFFGLALAKMLACIILLPLSYLSVRVHKVYKFIQPQAFWGDVLFLFLEGNFELLISSFMVLRAGDSADTTSRIVAWVYLTISLFLMPCLLLWVISRSSNTVDEIQFKRWWGMLYRDISQKSKWNLCYYLIFIFRRLIYVRLAFNTVENSTFQIIGLAFLNLFSMIYLGQVKPFKIKRLNRLELFNEFCIAMCTLHLLCFTDWVRSQKMHELMGWSLITIIVINILFNFFLIIKCFVREVCLIVRRAMHTVKKFWEWLKTFYIIRIVIDLYYNCRKAFYTKKVEGVRKDRDTGDKFSRGGVEWEWNTQNNDLNMLAVLATPQHRHKPTPSVVDCIQLNSSRLGSRKQSLASGLDPNEFNFFSVQKSTFDGRTPVMEEEEQKLDFFSIQKDTQGRDPGFIKEAADESEDSSSSMRSSFSNRSIKKQPAPEPVYRGMNSASDVQNVFNVQQSLVSTPTSGSMITPITKRDEDDLSSYISEYKKNKNKNREESKQQQEQPSLPTTPAIFNLDSRMSTMNNNEKRGKKKEVIESWSFRSNNAVDDQDSFYSKVMGKSSSNKNRNQFKNKQQREMMVQEEPSFEESQDDVSGYKPGTIVQTPQLGTAQRNTPELGLVDTSDGFFQDARDLLDEIKNDFNKPFSPVASKKLTPDELKSRAKNRDISPRRAETLKTSTRMPPVQNNPRESLDNDSSNHNLKKFGLFPGLDRQKVERRQMEPPRRYTNEDSKQYRTQWYRGTSFAQQQ